MNPSDSAKQATVSNGLGFLATCTCEDAEFHHGKMTQGQIQSRWGAAQRINVECAHYLNGDPLRVYHTTSIENGHEHQVTVSVGEGDAGPHFYCKHILCVLANILFSACGIRVVNFGMPDAKALPTFKTISIDGWLQAVYLQGDRHED